MSSLFDGKGGQAALDHVREKSTLDQGPNLLGAQAREVSLRSYRYQKYPRSKRKRAFGRCLSGIQRSLGLGYKIVRRTKYSPLRAHVPCIMFITLTSSRESKRPINDAWSVLLKRLRRRYPKFEYFKLETKEGVCGVLHIVCRNSEFIPKQWWSENWSDTFQATVTWSVQCYGNAKSLLCYLMGYLKHHESFKYGFSQKWLFRGWGKAWRRIF